MLDLASFLQHLLTHLNDVRNVFFLYHLLEFLLCKICEWILLKNAIFDQIIEIFMVL